MKGLTEGSSAASSAALSAALGAGRLEEVSEEGERGFVGVSSCLSRSGRADGLRWPRFMRRGFSFGYVVASAFPSSIAQRTFKRGPRGQKHTVGGGLGLPSESSTFMLVRLATCSSKNALSTRSLSSWRRRRCRRSLAASLCSSIWLYRWRSWQHFRR